MTNLVQVSTTVKEYGDKYRIEIERADGSVITERDQEESSS